MIESKRPETKDPDHELYEHPRYWRICPECEQVLCVKEWNEMPEAEAEKNPDYTDLTCIKRDMKRVNKDHVWALQAQQFCEVKKGVSSRYPESQACR